MTPEERTLKSRMAAHVLHAKGGTNTGPARAAFMGRFEREVDSDETLEPAERAKRAEHARSAYFLALALKSAQARPRKGCGTAAGYYGHKRTGSEPCAACRAAVAEYQRSRRRS